MVFWSFRYERKTGSRSPYHKRKDAYVPSHRIDSSNLTDERSMMHDHKDVKNHQKVLNSDLVWLEQCRPTKCVRH